MSKTITQIELARLAATLARDNEDATRLTRRAFELWEASGKELVFQRTRTKEQTDPHSITINEPGKPPLTITIPPWPQTLKRNMTLDEFLRRMLPKLPLGKDEGERVKRYRHFLASRCTEPDAERQLSYAERELKEAKATGFNASEYLQEARAFLRWEALSAKQARSNRARKGAEALKAKRQATRGA